VSELSIINNDVFTLQDALLVLLVLILACACTIHAIIYKREHSAALSWLGFIFLSPMIFSLMFALFAWQGVLIIAPLMASLFYIFLGVNRLSREYKQAPLKTDIFQTQLPLSRDLPIEPSSKWPSLVKLGDQMGYSPPQLSNIEVLASGDIAYPKMLSAIDSAENAVYLMSYIFDYDGIGQRFCQSLAKAAARGVQVYVLVDAVGSAQSVAALEDYFKKQGVSFSVFLPVLLKTRFSNLRNHRKLLIVDNQQAFIGSLNITDQCLSDEHLATKQNKSAFIQDISFAVHGGILHSMHELFAHDWYFATQERLGSEPVEKVLEGDDQTVHLSRLIADGPSLEEERLRWHFLHAVNSAEDHIRIQTPYFLPKSSLVSALCSASLRGVKVDILVPAKSDHGLLDWAMLGNLFELLNRGCHIYFITERFDHSKIFIVDDDYVSLGSANWDARSLRLNYELNMEVCSQDLALSLTALFEDKKQQAKPYYLNQWLARPFWQKLRDGLARLFIPYL